KYNRWIVSPLEVRDHFTRFREERGLATELVVMLPGSGWSDTCGFDLADTTAFDDRDATLVGLAAANASVLEEAYRREAKVEIQVADIDRYFSSVFAHSNWWVRRLFRDGRVTIRAFSGDAASYWT